METIWVLGDAVVDLLPDGEGKLLQCRRRTGQRRGRGSASGRQKRLYRPGGRRPLRAFYAKRLQMSRLIQNGCGWTRSIAPPRWWWISITTVNVPLPLWFARALIYSSTLPISRHSAPGVAARLLYRAQRRTQPFRDVSGDGRDQTGGGFVSFDPNIRADLWHDEVELRQCLERALACADVVKISEEELAFLTGNAQVHEGLAALMRTCPAGLVLVTQGKRASPRQEGVLTLCCITRGMH